MSGKATRAFSLYSVPFFNEPFGEIGVAKPNLPNRVSIFCVGFPSVFGDFRFLCSVKTLGCVRLLVGLGSTQPTRLPAIHSFLFVYNVSLIIKRRLG